MFFAGRGLSVPWMVSYLVITVTAVSLTWAGLRATLLQEMNYRDAAQTASSLGVIAVSALAALLLRPEVAWREQTAGRSLFRYRVMVVAFGWLALSWPLLSGGGLGLQHLAVGMLMYGISCLLAPLGNNWVTAPHIIVLLIALIPQFLPPAWNPFTPAQRGDEVLLAGFLTGILGALVYVARDNRAG